MDNVPEIVLPDGTICKLGNIKPKAGLTKVWREYGSKDDEPIIDRGDWSKLIAEFIPGPDYVNLPYVHNQSNVGQCNPEATTAAIEAERLTQGLEFVKLSPADLYARINGGSDNGSLLEDALQEVTTKGVGTAATSGLLWNRRTREASEEERKQYRVLEFALLPSFAHCMSAVLKGRKIISGISWLSNYNPDREGWLPSDGGESVGGHAIFGYKPAERKGHFGIFHQNSWSQSFGLGGRMVVPEEAYDNAIGGWWAVRSVVDEGNVIPVK